jgi:hypothetical protein
LQFRPLRVSCARLEVFMKSKANYSLWLIAGALGVIASSAACMTCVERRRGRELRALELDVQNWEAEGGAITSREDEREETPML